MLPLSLSGYTAVSAMGRGVGEMLASLRWQHTGLRPCDFEDVALETWIGRVQGVEEVRLPARLERFDCRNNRLAWMALDTDEFGGAVRCGPRPGGTGRNGWLWCSGPAPRAS
jgi:3-oxoacyl-[acyl-carrier-protein] synthase I